MLGELEDTETASFRAFCMTQSRMTDRISARITVFDSRAWLEALELFMQFSVTFDRDEDGMWISQCPSIPGCVSQGRTKSEASKNIKKAIKTSFQWLSYEKKRII